jgi:hypothetical protein
MDRSGCCDVLTTADQSHWYEVLDRVGHYDFCHVPTFSRLAEQCGQGEARLLVFREGDFVMAFPLLVREIETASPHLAGAWQDVTSVYGYAGPLASSPYLSEETRARCCGFIEDFFHEHRVVSALTRLHPLLEQAPLLEGYGEVVPVGWTLSLDLRQSEEEQRSCYRRNHRQDIRKLESLGVVCEQAGAEHLDDFIEMYYDTMDRVGASPQYYFSKRYFTRLLEDMPEVAHLFMCWHEGEAIAGGIFTVCRGLVQWYFSGTRSSYGGPPPAKLLFDVARRWANDLGAHTLHLGGGVGGQRDSLYHFKCGFTHREHEYALWRHIVRPEVYQELYQERCRATGLEPEGAFFPRYRHPAFEREAADRGPRIRAAAGEPVGAPESR